MLKIRTNILSVISRWNLICTPTPLLWKWRTKHLKVGVRFNLDTAFQNVEDLEVGVHIVQNNRMTRSKVFRSRHQNEIRCPLSNEVEVETQIQIGSKLCRACENRHPFWIWRRHPHVERRCPYEIGRRLFGEMKVGILSKMDCDCHWNWKSASICK